MLKIWLKHSIYEQCLNALYNALSKNFITHTPKLSIGQKFSGIYINYPKLSNNSEYQLLLENAEILSIDDNLIYIEYDVMMIEGNEDTNNIRIVRDVDEFFYEDIVDFQC